jgi:predicted lipoprotein with Yx(FWY)xxD motif
MKLGPLVIAGLLGVASCGGSGDDDRAGSRPSGKEATSEDRAGGARERAGTEVRVAGSEFGRMLFDSNRQAIYVFQRDPEGRSACYGECALAWPPVFTDGRPVAGDGVRARLLGTVERRDGRLQVTYAGKPLYYYAHEEPGEVRCHNVNLNGGYWWVVGPDGERRA